MYRPGPALKIVMQIEGITVEDEIIHDARVVQRPRITGGGEAPIDKFDGMVLQR